MRQALIGIIDKKCALLMKNMLIINRKVEKKIIFFINLYSLCFFDMI